MNAVASTPPRITLDQPIAEATALEPGEWIGEIVTDEYRPKPKEFGGGYQWALAVKPLDGFVKGKTGAFHDFIDVKDLKDGTKLALVIDAFKNVFGESNTPIGDGKFNGRVAFFTRYTKVWGVNSKTGQEMKGSIMYPTRLATDEELKKYGRLAANDATDFEFTPELIAEAVEALDGATKAGIKKAIINAGISNPTLTQKLLSGEAVDYLLTEGHLTLDGNTYAKAA